LFNLGTGITMDSPDDGAFTHDEIDVTMMTYMQQSASFGKDAITFLNNDADVFVSLQMTLWKAADQTGPSKVGITHFVWEMKGGIPSPCVLLVFPRPRVKFKS